jgi:hypothetical protein
LPRSLNSATQAALDAGRVADRRMFLLDLGSGLYGFHNGLGPIVYNGVTYKGAGSLISIAGIRQTSDLSSVQVVGRLSSMANTALTPEVLSTIETEVYHQRPAQILTAYFNPDTWALLSVELEYRGYIDRIAHQDQVDGESILEVHLESRFRDHQRRGYRVRSSADQARIDPTDTGLKHLTAVSSETVTFGRANTTAAQQQYVPRRKSFFERIFG